MNYRSPPYPKGHGHDLLPGLHKHVSLYDLAGLRNVRPVPKLPTEKPASEKDIIVKLSEFKITKYTLPTEIEVYVKSKINNDNYTFDK